MAVKQGRKEVRVDGTLYGYEQSEDGFYVGEVKRGDSDYQQIVHPDGFVASFDITHTGSPDVWENLVAEHDLCQTTWKQPGFDLHERFVWFNDDVVITTTTNPLTGVCPRYEDGDTRYNPSNNVGRCGYIHIVGKEAVVKEIFQYIKNNSNVKDYSLGYFCV